MHAALIALLTERSGPVTELRHAPTPKTVGGHGQQYRTIAIDIVEKYGTTLLDTYVGLLDVALNDYLLVAAGPLVATVAASFFVGDPLGDASSVERYLSNTILPTGVLALLASAWRRTRRAQPGVAAADEPHAPPQLAHDQRSSIEVRR